MINRLFALLLVLVCSACFNYETQFEGPYDPDSEDKEEVVIPKEVVYVAGGNVYLANEFARDSVIIDDSGRIKVASINNNHTKVIYKENNQNIKIYDIESERITGEVPGSQDAFWFDFHANNETIYFFTTDSQLDTYGPEVLVKHPISLRTLSGVFGNARGGTVLENGDFIFSMESGGTFNNHFLFLADGNEVLEFRTQAVSKTHLRLDKEETILWSTDIFEGSQYITRVPSLSVLDQESQFNIGAPINSSQGYRVTRDNEIYTPQFVTLNSPGGIITAIDF